MANPDTDNTLLAARNAQARPYGEGTQILVVGIHGTNNGPGNVAGVTETIANALNNTTSGRVLHNSGFDWQAPDRWNASNEDRAGTAHTGNNRNDRDIASKRLAQHVLGMVDEQYSNGNFSRDKPLVLNLVGFSHGGNVAIQAVDEIVAGLKKRGLNEDAGIHLTTLSTPGYTGRRDPENPNGTARASARNAGVMISHSQYAVPDDGVITNLAGGRTAYANGFTRDFQIPALTSNIPGSQTNANHGRAQDDQDIMNNIANTEANRFRDFGRAQIRTNASLEGNETRVTAAQPTGDSLTDASARTLVSAKDFGNREDHFNKALSAANGNTDVAAALLKSSAAAGHDPTGDFRVEVSTKDMALIPAQGAGPGVNRGDGVVASQVQPGTAQNVAETLAQRNPAPQQIAAVEPVEKQMQQQPSRIV
jgi:hypothetical protein